MPGGDIHNVLYLDPEVDEIVALLDEDEYDALMNKIADVIGEKNFEFEIDFDPYFVGG